MSHTECQQCHQWLNDETSDHVVIKNTETGKVHTLHLHACVRVYALHHRFTILETHYKLSGRKRE